MENPRELYALPKHLNNGKAIVGLPIDEVLPALIFFSILFLAKYELTGFVGATVWFVGLRTLKTQFGDNVIALSIYWFGSKDIASLVFKRSPQSTLRYWLF